MKTVKVFVMALALIVLLISSANSQCGDPSQVVILHANCFTPLCHGHVFVPSAASCSAGSCDFFQNVTVDCCGTQAVTSEDVGPCGVAKLRDKRERRQLFALLKNYRVLAPACGGAYVPASSLLK